MKRIALLLLIALAGSVLFSSYTVCAEEKVCSKEDFLANQESNWPRPNPKAPPTEEAFKNYSAKDLMPYILGDKQLEGDSDVKGPDGCRVACAWFIWKTRDNKKLREELADKIVEKSRKVKHSHDFGLQISFLGPLGARKQLVVVLKETPRFSCHPGPDIVKGLGMCGTLEEVPVLIENIHKEGETCDGLFNRVLEKIIGIKMPLENRRTNKDLWRLAWKKNKELILKLPDNNDWEKALERFQKTKFIDPVTCESVDDFLNLKEIIIIQKHRDKAEEYFLKRLETDSPPVVGLILGFIKSQKALKLLRDKFINDRFFYGWEALDHGTEAFYLRDEQYIHHNLYIKAIQQITGKWIGESVTLTKKEEKTLKEQAAKASIKVEDSDQRRKYYNAKWILIKLQILPDPEIKPRYEKTEVKGLKGNMSFNEKNKTIDLFIENVSKRKIHLRYKGHLYNSYLLKLTTEEGKKVDYKFKGHDLTKSYESRIGNGSKFKILEPKERFQVDTISLEDWYMGINKGKYNLKLIYNENTPSLDGQDLYNWAGTITLELKIEIK